MAAHLIFSSRGALFARDPSKFRKAAGEVEGEMSSKAGKRPLRSLTAHEKLEAIRRVHDGESKASVARDIGVPESTLRGWCKNEDKISYLSRQSSPDTDESAPGLVEPKEKKVKLEEASPSQPYNLSKKGNVDSGSPGADYSKTDFDAAAAKPLNLNIKTDGYKTSAERERNRAELARLSVELGLNRPEMFFPNLNAAAGGGGGGGSTSASLAELTTNINLLAQWNTLLLQHQKMQSNVKVTTAPNDISSTTTTTASATVNQYQPICSTPLKNSDHKHKSSRLPKMDKAAATAAALDESVWYWLKTQPSMLGLMTQNGLPPACNTPTTSSTSPTNNVNLSSPNFGDGIGEHSSSWFWKWYKQLPNPYPLQQQLPEKPILYQQLTKEKDPYNSENIVSEKAGAAANHKNNNCTKARAVLDNLLCNNNNNLGMGKKIEVLSQNEAIEHGEKFLEWLECCGEPSVTAVQIMQLRYLLSNIKNRNNDLQSRAKVKRK